MTQKIDLDPAARTIDGIPSGMMSIFGRFPGSASPWTGPAFEETMYTLNYLTTKDAIAAALPSPLQPIEGEEPIATVLIGHNRHWRTFDGKWSNYIEVGFFLPCEYVSKSGEKYSGLHPLWFLMDNRSGDKTEGAEIAVLGYREISGWHKQIGNVHFGGTGDQVHATLEARGVRLATLDMQTREEADVSELPMAGRDYWLLVKEIPNCDFTGYDVRKVIGRSAKGFSQPGSVTNLKRGTGTVEFGYLESHPIAGLECIEPRDAHQFTFGGTVEGTLHSYFEIDDLLKD
ncbi:acetoacetate decarboxylase family protein [Pseudarthrobacter sulfonivorans]|uniref:acetoacetate decarboxylase family protein n=1 Tax=Pseudarthrobacter sulfonivorans TaxID=121292 RepID=UPI002107D10E|nr:acetoacetate decarboxylase family protein [Pseudarthrobacter sulfonivorans]